MRVLMLGDVVGRPGRRLLAVRLPALRREREIDFVVANGENAAGGAGITPRTLGELLEAGVDVVTSGNHVFRHREILPLLEAGSDRLLRPANFPARAPGRGWTVRTDGRGRAVGVLNLQGRTFLPAADDPFAAAEEGLNALRDRAAIVLVDLHAEATSDKKAMGFYLDGRVAVVAGTHTHVPTADARVLPGGTAYITDLGMTGPHDSCLGVRTEIIVNRYLTGVPSRFEVAGGDVRLQGLLVDVEEETGLARSVERIEEEAS